MEVELRSNFLRKEESKLPPNTFYRVRLCVSSSRLAFLEFFVITKLRSDFKSNRLGCKKNERDIETEDTKILKPTVTL